MGLRHRLTKTFADDLVVGLRRQISKLTIYDDVCLEQGNTPCYYIIRMRTSYRKAPVNSLYLSL